MTQHRISVSKRIAAPAKRVYAIIADYERGHPRILPKPPFVSLVVASGGTGAGTEIELVMRILGRLETYRGVVSEPVPGRVISERYVGTSTVTTFTVEPDASGRCEVTITTDTDVRAGFLGALRRWVATRVLRPVYVRELEQLAAVAAGSPA